MADPEWVFGDDVGMPGAGWMDREEWKRRLESPTTIVPTVAPMPAEPDEGVYYVDEDGSQYMRLPVDDFDNYDAVDSRTVQARSGLPTLTSQNGWSANDRSVIASYTVPGSTRQLALRRGDCSVVLLDILGWIHANVVRVDTGQLDDWGYAERTIRGSSTELSNHASGTAADLDALRHPLGVRGTWTTAQYAAIRGRLKFYEGVVRWGADYTGRVDEMHFEINAGPAEVARIANKVRGVAPAPVKNGGSVPGIWDRREGPWGGGLTNIEPGGKQAPEEYDLFETVKRNNVEIHQANKAIAALTALVQAQTVLIKALGDDLAAVKLMLGDD